MTMEAVAEATIAETPAVLEEAPATPVALSEEPVQEIAEVAQPEATDAPEPETLDKIFERNEALKAEYEDRLRVRENAAAQRREAQLRREAGSIENTRAQSKRFLEGVVAPLGVDVSEIPTQALDYMYMLAAENSLREIASALPQAILGNYDLTPEQRLAAVEARDELVTLADGSKGPNHDAYVKSLVEAAVQNRAGTLKLSDVPESAPLRREIRAEAAKIAAAEIRAAKIEAQPKVDAPPRPPMGQPLGTSGPITWALIDSSYTDSQFAALPAEERARLSAAANAAGRG